MHAYCTIVSSHYLPHALTLAESFSAIYPNEDLSVLVLDVEKGTLPRISNVVFYHLEDLDIDAEVLKKMLTYYDVVEFATALKPSFLIALLDKGVETVSYIDPDIYLFNKLDVAQSLASVGGIAITPHRLTPMPYYPNSPKELSFFRVGIYNLGFICVGPKSRTVLLWWQERLRWHASQFDQLPYFTDQRWADFFPSFEGCSIIRHPGYNVAYWNLDERTLHENNGHYFVNGEVLVFVHYSQMSSQLMLSFESHLWGSWLDVGSYSANSLKMITELSTSYGKSLRDARTFIEGFEISVKLKFGKISKFKQSKIIRKDINGVKFNLRRIQYTTLYTTKIGKVLEKSIALNGLRVGLHADFRKLKSRLGSFKILQHFQNNRR